MSGHAAARVPPTSSSSNSIASSTATSGAAREVTDHGVPRMRMDTLFSRAGVFASDKVRSVRGQGHVEEARADHAHVMTTLQRRATHACVSFVVCVSNLREVLLTTYAKTMRKGLHYREASATLCTQLRVCPGRKPGVPGECQPRQLSYFRR